MKNQLFVNIHTGMIIIGQVGTGVISHVKYPEEWREVVDLELRPDSVATFEKDCNFAHLFRPKGANVFKNFWEMDHSAMYALYNRHTDAKCSTTA